MTEYVVYPYDPLRETIQAQIDRLLPKAETGEQWAEICRLEAVMNGGPWFD